MVILTGTMEAACSLSLSTVFYGGEASSCKALEQLDFKPQLKCGYYGNIFGDLRLQPNKNLLKKLRKSTACCFSSGFSSVSKGGNSWIQRYSSNGSSISGGHIFPIVKHSGISQHRRNVPVARAKERGRDEEVKKTVEDDTSLESIASGEISTKEGTEAPCLDEWRESLKMALNDLEAARINRKLYEEKAQRVSEAAIALNDAAANAGNDVNRILASIQQIANAEAIAKEGVQKATMSLSLAEARLQVIMDSAKNAQESNGSAKNSKGKDSAYESGEEKSSAEEVVFAAQHDIKVCQIELANREADFRREISRKEELQKEAHLLNAAAEQAQLTASKAEEEVANIMLLAEQAVAYELRATQHVNDAEIALQRAEKDLDIASTDTPDSAVEAAISEQTHDVTLEKDRKVLHEAADLPEPSQEGQLEELRESDESEKEKARLCVDQLKEKEAEAEKFKTFQSEKQEMKKEPLRKSAPFSAPNSPKLSSRFFSASFFSFSADRVEFISASAFHGILETARRQLPKLVLGTLLLGAGIVYANRSKKVGQLHQGIQIVTTNADEVLTTAKPVARYMRQLPAKMKKLIGVLPHQKEEEAFLCDVLWLLLASVIFVPIFQKLPGGSPVLGYLAAGILIGPYGLSIIRNVHETKAIAEFGVVFLLFNIGLELSVERLSSMKKYVFGLGLAQFLATAVALGLLFHNLAGLSGPAAIVIGNGLALSSTAVVLQVLQERGETASRHGRATFSVLLFQDLAVVVLLILIPLISPSSSKGGVGFQAIAEALGLAALKAVISISVIIAGGRTLLRPVYKQIAKNQNKDIFTSNTLLVILGTSLFTARAGLSMALGAFLAGLLLAETEFSLQIESEIAAYRGILLGLFFMTVGMSIDPKRLVSNFSFITGTIGLLIAGKTILVVLAGKLFGLSMVSAIRVGLLLAPGGEFAFVAFGDAVNQGIMSSQLSSQLFLVVGISMAITPWLAAGGQLIASRLELKDVRNLLPNESEIDDLQDHVIICGFGRIGQIIAQILSERLIPFVALDVRSDRVALGRSLELPVYFADAGSLQVLHKIGAERACAAAITLDTPGANYRTVWALNKNFPNVKTFVRAHDVDHGRNLEKAGATEVVPELLESSLQLAAAILAQTKLPKPMIIAAINDYRRRQLSELRELSEASRFSLGYGFS